MIYVNFIKISSELTLEYLLQRSEIPEFIRKRMDKYKRSEDKIRFLLGKLILKKMLINKGYPVDILNYLKTDSNGRPYINERIDFNISHSGKYVLCAVSEVTRVGIDVEQIKEINIDEISYLVLNIAEKNKLSKADKSLSLFYDIWTLKEAALKANGKGLIASMSNVEIFPNHLICEFNSWNFKKLNIDEKYSCHIVFKGSPLLKIDELNISNLN